MQYVLIFHYLLNIQECTDVADLFYFTVSDDYSLRKEIEYNKCSSAASIHRTVDGYITIHNKVCHVVLMFGEVCMDLWYPDQWLLRVHPRVLQSSLTVV